MTATESRDLALPGAEAATQVIPPPDARWPVTLLVDYVRVWR